MQLSAVLHPLLFGQMFSASAQSKHHISGTLHALENDAELLAGFRKGDRVALGEIFRRYVPVVTRALRGGARTRNGHLRFQPDEFDVESLIQETFVRAFSASARARYDGLRPFSAYIATIAKNLLIDEARKRARRPIHLDLDGVAESADERWMAAPEENLLAHELYRCLRSFRSALSKRDSDIFDARYAQQLSLRGTAKHLGLSVFTVRKADARLRLALLEQLRGAGFFLDRDLHVAQAVIRRSGPRKESSHGE